MTVPTNNEEAPTAEVIAGWIRDDVFAGRDAGESLYPVSERLAERIVTALAARRPPVSGDNAELIAELAKQGNEVNEFVTGDPVEFRAIEAIQALSASQPREAAPSDTDRQLLNDVIYESWNSERGDEIPWIPAVGRFKLAASILAAGFSRTSHPVQVEDDTALSEQRIPLYAMLDIWMAHYGTSHPEFDEFYAKHGYAETWARLLSAVRTSHPVQVEVTDAMIERAARSLFDGEGANPGDYTWAEMLDEDPKRADIWRDDARAALAAALGGGE